MHAAHTKRHERKGRGKPSIPYMPSLSLSVATRRQGDPEARESGLSAAVSPDATAQVTQGMFLSSG
jgi:hypothetical protein